MEKDNIGFKETLKSNKIEVSENSKEIERLKQALKIARKKSRDLRLQLNLMKQESQKALEQEKHTKAKELDVLRKTLVEEKKRSETLKTQTDALKKTIQERTKEKETLNTTLQAKEKVLERHREQEAKLEQKIQELSFRNEIYNEHIVKLDEQLKVIQEVVLKNKIYSK